MYAVGSDQLAMLDERAVPAGRRHAVAGDGRALCRNGRPRFTWPGLTWSGVTEAGSSTSAADEERCPLCVQVQRAHLQFASIPAYPSEQAEQLHVDSGEPIGW
jgi:hypothetical protein